LPHRERTHDDQRARSFTLSISYDVYRRPKTGPRCGSVTKMPKNFLSAVPLKRPWGGGPSWRRRFSWLGCEPNRFMSVSPEPKILRGYQNQIFTSFQHGAHPSPQALHERVCVQSRNDNAALCNREVPGWGVRRSGECAVPSQSGGYH